MCDGQSDKVRNEWTVEISLEERQGHASATARLRGPSRESAGSGLSRLKSHDRSVAGIGDDLAVARALADLARRMMVTAAQDIELVTRTW